MVTDSQVYKEIPENWSILIADIKGSTKAIENGRYKDVNTLGAACIAAARNVVAPRDLAYIFGGDGATLLLSPDLVENVSMSLREAILMAEDDFGMELRVGLVPISKLKSEGASIQIAKHQLKSGLSLTAIKGKGVSLAESWIKKEGSPYLLSKLESRTKDLFVGLSCRWQPILPRKDRIASLIILARGNNSSELYSKLLTKITDIFSSNLLSANPILSEEKNYKGFWQNIKDELRFSAKLFSIDSIKRLFGVFVTFLIFKLKFKFLFKDVDRYTQSLAFHTDFQKFEGGLKLTLDCSKTQLVALKNLLEDMCSKGEIYYGLFESHAALMTCFVPGTGDGNHIHFVDGSDGGYAMAAKQLKAQTNIAT